MLSVLLFMYIIETGWAGFSYHFFFLLIDIYTDRLECMCTLKLGENIKTSTYAKFHLYILKYKIQ